MYSPKRPFIVPFDLQEAHTSMIKGVQVKTWQSLRMVFCSFVTFGGTEHEVNGVLSVEDTGIVECFFDPDIKASSRLVNLNTGIPYEIAGTPENIEGRNQYLRIKVRAVLGGA
jgi:head-tail adaptor